MRDYYSGNNFEVFDVIEAFDLNFNLGNVAKYICRCGKKGNAQDAINDLCKAISYLEREIETRQKKMSDLEGLARREAQ